jgi:hypothetical protein
MFETRLVSLASTCWRFVVLEPPIQSWTYEVEALK